jgi:chondroitin 4-sulfotransferase 11
MLVSHGRCYVFIHIQKTAGSSVETALRSVTPDSIFHFDDLPACRDPLKGRHLFASDLQEYLGESTWNSYYKFAFVRNPWSRLVSWYNMCVVRPTNQFMYLVKERTRSFEDFLEMTDGLARKTVFNQADYVTDRKGKLSVDFVGRFETIERDFQQVCANLGINVKLPRENQGLGADYRAYYNDRTRRVVSERFARDIETFGYQFE